MMPDEFSTRIQRKAEAHLDACSEAFFAEQEGEDVESPAYGPYDGCNTCVVREVLSVTWVELLEGVQEEDDDWFIPGGPFITDERRIRLHPPRSWDRYVLEVPRVPPSMNTDQVRSFWRFYEHKQSWQDELMTLLMTAGVKRDGYQRAIAGAFMRFPRHVARRDSGNFAHVVNKALGDALARDSKGHGYGAIPDDDERRYHFGGVEFEEETGRPRTRILIYLQPEEG